MTSSANNHPGPRNHLRQLVLAVSVTHDVDVTMADEGVRLDGPHDHLVTWAELENISHGIPAPEDQRDCVYQRLLLHSTIASLGDSAGPLLRTKLRAVALPTTSPLHPGQDWVQERVPGGVLDRGLGVHGMVNDPNMTVPLPTSLAALAGINAAVAWQDAATHAEEMASLMVCRLQRDACSRDENIVLRPMGGVDVLSLLGTTRMRKALAQGDGTGMRAVAAPTRERGWVDLQRIDPAFVATAFHAADILNEGLEKPLLVTEDEVAYSPVTADPQKLLRDEVVDLRPWERSRRFR